MPPILHLPLSILLLSSFFLPFNSQTLYDYPTAFPNTTWINSRPLSRDMASYLDGSKIRTILLRGASGPCFAAGFFCSGPCNAGFLFSIFTVNTSSESEIMDKPFMIPPVLWSANRNRLVGENATLRFTKGGNFILLDADGSLVWSTNTENRSVSSMELTHSGNLILLDRNNKSVWSSFENPTDTLLDGQILVHGKSLSSNSSSANAARGRFFLSLQDQGFYAYVDSNPPQLYAKILKWAPSPSPTNLGFNNGALEWTGDSVEVVSNPSSWAMKFIRIEFDGHLRIYGIGINSIPGVTILQDYSNYILNYCDYPLVCGRYGICFNGQCSCPVNVSDGDSSFFQPISWGQINPGCSPVNPISCNSTESHRLLPLGTISYFNYIDENAAALRGTDEESCKNACLMNCSCKAALFRYRENSSQGDCYLPAEIFSLKNASEANYSSSAYIKVQIGSDSSPLPSKKKSKTFLIVVLTPILGILLLTSLMVFILLLKRSKTKPSLETEEADQFDQMASVLTRFSFEELELLTEGFKRKIGRGGFGSVFEGALRNGTKVAVKKLEGVGQGMKEFLAEVETIGNIHHIHLVQLIGFCAEKSHRLLVYEFMPNGSLDRWIFGVEQEAFLAWETRRKIILDIAKGLCYLHEGCRRRIAHLDIKPQNILLDQNFNAKLADFGLSKLIDREQSQVMTRMRGTPGYLAPEWLTSIITEKVDVYSFGVVILEIMSGRKNLDPSQPEEAVHLISLLDASEPDSLPEIFRPSSRDMKLHSEDELRIMMRLAASCLQNDAKRRPSMSVVVKILEGCVDLESDRDNDFFGFYPFMMESSADSDSQVLLSHEG